MPNWDEYYASGRDFSRLSDEVMTTITSFISQTQEKTALDIGCGTGYLVRQLTACGFIAAGVDPSRRAIERARRQDERGVYTVGDIAAIDNRFDLITCKHVYAFIDDRSSFLTVVRNHLKPGGVFAVVTPTLDRVIENKPAIAVDKAGLFRDLAVDFEIVAQQELPIGLLVVCRSR